MEVNAGNLRAIGTAFPHDNAMRIELIPGTGQVMVFKIENKEVIGFRYDGVDFLKVDN